MTFIEKKIAIENLSLWDENARFPDKYYNKEEIELVSYFLSKAEFKIKPLIEEIIKDFDLPQLEKLVVWNDNGQNIVLEGNRRLTAYKLLNDPELTENSSLKNFLLEQKLKISISENYRLECIVTENKADCFRYIDRKHYNVLFQNLANLPHCSHYNVFCQYI